MGDVNNKDGLWWYEHPKPRRFHRCRPVTKGFALGGYVERCACGAIRPANHGPWIEKNSRKRE